jgi:hypothetical protein
MLALYQSACDSGKRGAVRVLVMGALLCEIEGKKGASGQLDPNFVPTVFGVP